MYYPNIRMKNKVPILSSDEINSHAERFISEFDEKMLIHPHAIDLEAFLEFYLELDMEYEYLSCDNSCLGMTVFNNTNKIPAFDKVNNCAKYIAAHEGTIIVDNSLVEGDQEKRLRFTLGHEAGHWIYHKAFFGYNPGQMTLFEMDTAYTRCRSVNNNYIYRRTENWDREKWMEWQADKFSACLLMPECSVKHLLKDVGYVGEEISLLEDVVDNISCVFNVSNQAAFYRLCDLKYINTKDKKQIDYQLSLFD